MTNLIRKLLASYMTACQDMCEVHGITTGQRF